MRDVKFRAWDKNIKEMRPVFSINNLHEKDDYEYKYIISNQKINGEGTIDWKDVELMQYTGLKDKNGKEIYEGDIVIDTNKSHSDYNNKRIVTISPTKGTTLNDISLGYRAWKWYEIIGNIYENSELLNTSTS